jgi:hypothetical protein
MKNILGFVLQSFAIVLGIYTFNRKRLIFKEYLLTSIFVTILIYFMKILPIAVGVQTILNMISIYLICVLFLKMPAYKTIRSTSICFVLILFCEMIVTAIVVKIIGPEQFEIIVKDPMQKYYIGVLANTLFAIIITSFYYVLKRKGDNYRKIGS